VTETQDLTALDVITDLMGLRGRSGADDDPSSTLGLVSGPGGPKFLVPLGWRAAMLASCTAFQGLREPRTRASRLAVAAALSTRPGRRFALAEELVADVGPGSLLAHLREVLGRDELAVAIGVGRMHELWRPTLQLFAPDGTPLAYVKVGYKPVDAAFVANEAEVLRRWSAKEDPRLVVPEVVAQSQWRGNEILLVAPMPEDVRRLPPGPVGAWGVRTLDEPLPDMPVAEALWWTERRKRFADDEQVDALLGRIEDRHGGPDRSWARWHGDWVPWNLARSRRGLVAWDWEYSEPGAPVGLDETHETFQIERWVRGRSVADALVAARRVAPSTWVADAHVAMLVTRYADFARSSGTRMADHDEVLRAAIAAVG